MKLSVVLATRNEEKNIERVLACVKDIADEIIVVDENSTDKTRNLAKKMGARVFRVKHERIFHKTKQKAIDKAKGKWILQLDADEVVTPSLLEEIKAIVNMDNKQIRSRVSHDRKKTQLFIRHQQVVEKRDGKFGNDDEEIVAFFVPRKNYFLGKPLKYAGTYPDGVIRLMKNGRARFPAKSVHEQIEIDGKVDWLFNDLEHHDSPTLSRYFARMSRYTDLKAEEFQKEDIGKNPFLVAFYLVVKPLVVFLTLFIRHKGILDGWRGLLWSLFSALHFPVGYYKYVKKS